MEEKRVMEGIEHDMLCVSLRCASYRSMDNGVCLYVVLELSRGRLRLSPGHPVNPMAPRVCCTKKVFESDSIGKLYERHDNLSAGRGGGRTNDDNYSYLTVHNVEQENRMQHQMGSTISLPVVQPDLPAPQSRQSTRCW